MEEILKFLLIFCLFFAISVNLYSFSLVTTFQGAPPKYINGEELSGIAFDIFVTLKKKLKDHGIDITWDGNFKTMVEIQELLQSCKVDFFVGMAKTPERQKKFVFSKMPIYSINSLLLLKKGIKDVSKIRIGVISSTKTSKELPQSMKDNAEFVKISSIDKAMAMLLNGKLDGIFYNSMSLGYYYSKHRNLLYPVLMFSRKYYQYVVFSRCVNPKVVEEANKAIEDMIKSGKIEEIIKKYRLERFVKPPNEISMVAVPFAPYSYIDKEGVKGIEIDILKKVFKDIGYNINFYMMNYKRAVEYVKRGIMDGIVPVIDMDTKSFYISGEPMETRVYGYAVLKNNPFKENYQCGYVGEILKEVSIYDKSCKWISVPDFKKGMLMLTYGRIDKLFIDKLSFVYYSKLLNNSEIEFIPKTIRLNTYVGFSKSDDYYEYLKDRFSEELKEYKTSGEYIKVLNKYGISYEDPWPK